MLKENFFRDCFRLTGWIPMQPLHSPVAIGDLCQIHNRHLQVLTSLNHLELTEKPLCSDPVPLNHKDWRIYKGVHQTMCAIEEITQQHARENIVDDVNARNYWTRQVLQFDESGSFIFHGNAPYAKVLRNWYRIKDDTTLKITQTHYAFRDIYLVTGVAVVDEWALAIAGAANAELSTSTEARDMDLFTLISHTSARTNECRDVACYEKSSGQPAYFFRAKKLILSDRVQDAYLKRLLDNARDLGARELGNWLGNSGVNNSLLNLMTSNELNLSTAIEFFSWADASLDDVEKLLK